MTLGIYTFFWVFRTHREIKDYSGEGVGAGLGLLIYVLASPATWFLVPRDVHAMLARHGRTSRVDAKTGLWVLLPILGAFVWFPRVQGELNDFWRTAP